MARAAILNWELASLFPWGSDHEEFDQFMTHIQEQLFWWQRHIECGDWVNAISLWQDVANKLRHGFAFIACHVATHTPLANIECYQRDLVELEKKYSALLSNLQNELSGLSRKKLNAVLKAANYTEQEAIWSHRLQAIYIRELSSDEKSIRETLQKKYRSFETLYHHHIAQLKVVLPDVGTYPLPALQKRLPWLAQPPQDLAFYQAYQSCLHAEQEYFCELINDVYATKLQLQAHHPDISYCPSGISSHCVQEFFNTVDDCKGIFILFISKKAELLGHKRPVWSDIDTHLTQSNQCELLPHETLQWVLRAFSHLGSEIHDFCRKLTIEKHVQIAPSNLHHNIYSFALALPCANQVRVFLRPKPGTHALIDYARQMMSAWIQYQEIINPCPLQSFPTLVKETLCTFAQRLAMEMISNRHFPRQLQFDVLFSYLQHGMLDTLQHQLQCLFDSKMLQDRLINKISSLQINQSMLKLQQQVYSIQMGSYFSQSWISDCAYYCTDVVMRDNVGKSMGFLLGNALYKKYIEQPQGFSDLLKKWALGAHVATDLNIWTKNILGENLDSPQVWQLGMSLLEGDLRRLGDLIQTKDCTFSLEMKGY